MADESRPGAFDYTVGALSGAGCMPLAVGGVPDHAHPLFGLSRTRPLTEVVEVVKKRSSVWPKDSAGAGFAW